MTLLFELLVFGTMLSWYEALGGAIILTAIIWIFLPGLRRNVKLAAE
jgi:drug/metabolite transporter (DMT)-like permease